MCWCITLILPSFGLNRYNNLLSLDPNRIKLVARKIRKETLSVWGEHGANPASDFYHPNAVSSGSRLAAVASEWH
jgi:hypothetical protein